MNSGVRILVIDDEKSVCEYLEELLSQFGYHIRTALSGKEALSIFNKFNPTVVTLDMAMPGMSGMETLSKLREINPMLPVIVISGNEQTGTIVEAMRLGATDYLTKPFESEEVRIAINKVLRKQLLEREVESLRNRIMNKSPYEMFGAAGEKVREIKRIVEQVADTDVTVLIRGESGTGKELVAKAIYNRSTRKGKPFVKVNCAALPSELLESELFGFERGAFTGAQKRKAGRFEMAHQGVIFLDEISEISLPLQTKLLQVLQDGVFSRLGSEEEQKVDTRILAATNRDLYKSVKEGSFREDLFYRLNVVNVYVPPLRERRDEIPDLIDHFLQKYTNQYDKDFPGFSDKLIQQFMTYSWPGNVRELENLVKRAVVLGDERPITKEIDMKRLAITQECIIGEDITQKNKIPFKGIVKQAVRKAEGKAIRVALERTRWNRKEAAELLQISYKALLYKIKENNLDRYASNF